jgi:hypothetical protein
MWKATTNSPYPLVEFPACQPRYGGFPARHASVLSKGFERPDCLTRRDVPWSDGRNHNCFPASIDPLKCRELRRLKTTDVRDSAV